MLITREMTLEDLDRILEIERSSFSNPISKTSLEKEITNNDIARYYLIEEFGQIIGYFGFWIIADQGHILSIAVDEKYRNKGYGKKLVSSLIKVAENESVQKLTLEVRESNQVARRLYRSFGFEELAKRKDYYRDPKEDAIIMWLDLGEDNGN